jgi:hypothetical protein
MEVCLSLSVRLSLSVFLCLSLSVSLVLEHTPLSGSPVFLRKDSRSLVEGRGRKGLVWEEEEPTPGIIHSPHESTKSPPNSHRSLIYLPPPLTSGDHQQFEFSTWRSAFSDSPALQCVAYTFNFVLLSATLASAA